jgi:hypothetical protein
MTLTMLMAPGMWMLLGASVVPGRRVTAMLLLRASMWVWGKRLPGVRRLVRATGWMVQAAAR